MTTTHYHSSSRGPVEIGSMIYEHARNAHAKLTREEPHRQDEIRALNEHMLRLEADGAGSGL